MYKCIEGTKQFGTGELSVTCEADGTWSANTIFCRRSCPPPPIPLHAKPLTLTRNCNKIKPFTPGDTCKYRCKQGYRPSGLYIKKVSSKGHFVQRCLKGGEWTKKRCIQVTCPVDDPMIFRWYNCTLGSSLGSVCSLACPGEEVRVLFQILVIFISHSAFTPYFVVDACLFGATRKERTRQEFFYCAVINILYQNKCVQ